MGPRFVAAALVLLLGPAPAGAAPTGAVGLASPLVNRAIYREGAVRRSTAVFANWRMVCDEITDLRQRFCSLRAATPANAQGKRVAVDVSTGDDGKPALLVHLPLGVLVRFGVRIAPAPPADATRPPGPSEVRTVGIVRCSASECAAVADLRPQDLAALDHGKGLLVSYCALASDPLAVAPGLERRGCEIDLHNWLSGAGFRAAIAAALRS